MRFRYTAQTLAFYQLYCTDGISTVKNGCLYAVTGAALTVAARAGSDFRA